MAEKTFKEKVLIAQKTLKAPKGQMNKFGGYKYRSCEDILEAAKPILTDLGLILTLSDCIAPNGDRYYVRAEAVLSDSNSNESISVTAYAREPEIKKGMDESQITGTASSYARKYALNGLFCIDDTKDADTDEYARQTGREEKKTVTPPQMKKSEPEAPKTASEPHITKCADCGNRLFPETIKGKTWGIEQLAMASEKKYGRVLCTDCRKKIESENK